ncbi:MAG: transposase [Tepidimonas sp.]|uniref:transposase n=1 Tax=Tepidimonas sp. TaxID=2002775 RepID=UPI00259EA952|nr:transposase [Tepidimonas sp.]MDM7457200.1 transposase [Tepidimonas sp.]
MARLPRLSVTDWPHLVFWQGNNRQAVFVDDDDRQAFVTLLGETAAREGVEVHGYALLDSALWLVVTPRRQGGLSRLMQGLGRSYVRRFNARHGRSGTLWEGRYRATVLAPEQVLPALAMLDLEPVRLGLAPSPQDWTWSTHRHYTGVAPQRGVQPPPPWWGLGDTPFAREAAYRQRVQGGLPPAQAQGLREAAIKGWPVGDAAFLAALAEQTGRRTQPARPGRPRKTQ